MRCCSSLGHGLLWFLFETRPRYKFLFTRTTPTLEQWPAWAQQRVVWRTRDLGEKWDVEQAIGEALKIITQ